MFIFNEYNLTSIDILIKNKIIIITELGCVEKYSTCISLQ